MSAGKKKIAVWALTSGAARLAGQLERLPATVELFVSSRVDPGRAARRFQRLAPALGENFRRFDGHVFIMAAGIVVRQIAGLLDHKTRDPAVVVMDETGRWAISLVSGHLGGANELARQVAGLVGARPVITTATDCLGKPAIDILAAERGLVIANPEAIKAVNMALVEGKKPLLHDPQEWLGSRPPGFEKIRQPDPEDPPGRPVVLVSQYLLPAGPDRLLLHPPCLALGLGCRRGTPLEDLRRALFRVLESRELAAGSIFRLATADVKRHEESIARLAEELSAELVFYSPAELKTVEDRVAHSALVEKHVGVKSVCEAAAILAAGNGQLIVPKQKTALVTIALARRPSML